MRVLVVYCHPNETSFASALHQTVLKALRSRGHEVTDLDLCPDCGGVMLERGPLPQCPVHVGLAGIQFGVEGEFHLKSTVM